MADAADPRIALMQKWSQENPELLAHAGLAAAAGGNIHHLGLMNDTRPGSAAIMQYQKSIHDHKHKNKAQHGSWSTKEVETIARASKAGVFGKAHENHKKTKKHVKYYNLDPKILSENTEKAREEVVKFVSNSRVARMILESTFSESDKLPEAKKIVELYDKYHKSNSESDFEEVYSRLFLLSTTSKRVISGSKNIPARTHFKNQDFHVYGPETQPLMKKAFILKTLYHILFQRYIKTLPPKKEQNEHQTSTAQKMSEAFKVIDKPYRALYEYGRALRIRRAEAITNRKVFPSVHNASLKTEFSDCDAGTFSLSNPHGL